MLLLLLQRLLSFVIIISIIIIILILRPAYTSPSSPPSSESSTPLLSFLTRLPPLPSQQLLQWNSSAPPCHWSGVSCSPRSGRITSLNLSGIGLSGPLAESAPSLCGLPSLRSLDLSLNGFSGPIPSQLGSCARLRALLLNGNNLSGPIPLDFFRSGRLVKLDLGENSLSGAIPPQVGSSRRLVFLGLNDNFLQGGIPQGLLRLPKLKFLWLDGNNITGESPSFHLNAGSSGCPFLATRSPASSREAWAIVLLYLNDNNFAGELPRSLETLRNLQQLFLSHNQFNGTIPANIGRCRSLTMLYIWGNRLTGLIPPSIGDLRDLQYLLLARNQLGGPIPPEIGNCRLLLELQLQENLIGGSIPPEICQLQNLQNLYLYKNHLEGAIPNCVWRMHNLVSLVLYNNSLSGEMPTEVALLGQLNYINLAYNNLTGEIPYSLGRNTIGGLKLVDLTGNNFYGPIPPDLCAGGNLSVLVLGHNQFNGSFPGEIIARCSSLRRVILCSNSFRGNIPVNMSVNLGISYLDLSSNFLEGSIPSRLGYWHNLSMLDISNNSLSGPIPPELGNLKNLATLRASSNKLTGSIPAELGGCTKLLCLDLTRNNLSGNIPVEITTLVSLQNLLLSGNKLSGAIPDSFTALQGLLELELGNNTLEGSIPRSLDPSSLDNMVSLSFVNVSFNQLTGSFVGNPYICLQAKDGNDCEKEPIQHRGKTRRIIIILMVLGFVILLGGLCGTIHVTMRARRLSAPQVSIRSIDATEDLPEDLTYEDILRATGNLSEKYVIGRGRHGTVYCTEFGWGKKWAVKMVDLSESSFSVEIKVLNSVKHRNLVKMAGYCIRDGFGLILYEYISGGTLYEVLHQRKPQVSLDWKSRYRIALGIAQGLSYLHHDCVPQIIHRDIKSSNILMDSELEPKIGDFGMAKMISSIDSSSTMSAIVGTLGYIAPECGYSTRVNEKCDVYSYGVVLLELLCRKLPVDPSFGDGVDIVQWMKSKLQKPDYENAICYLDEEIIYWEVEQAKVLKLLKWQFHVHN
uniref:Protein kinase domain-containing protein n=1 Tax=Ananas comosus var. bracteatus TaxID=296719 RepID=A0A6V7PXW8_ANACO|nr:unnamed protein product [Ananas comosus var. bracteatus]